MWEVQHEIPLRYRVEEGLVGGHALKSGACAVVPWLKSEVHIEDRHERQIQPDGASQSLDAGRRACRRTCSN